MRQITYYEDENSRLFFSRCAWDATEAVLEVFLHTPSGYTWEWEGFLQPDEKSKDAELYGEVHSFEESFGGSGIINLSPQENDEKELTQRINDIDADCKAEFYMEDRRDNYSGVCETILTLANEETQTVENILRVRVCGDREDAPQVFVLSDVEAA